jgi:putative ABC transport system ATP-binding protein
VLENTMLPMDYTNTYARSERPQRALELLQMVGLENQADKLPIALSSGQQQSAAIARALANDPPIIVADEPTGNLDSRSADKIIQLFSTLAERGKTILIVTHDPSITGRTDRILTISDGEIIDEAIARALPMLNHRQMLNITHLIGQRSFQPGVEILRQGSQVADFWVVKSGEVEITLLNRRGSEQTVARLGAGQFFGEIELLRGGGSIASVIVAPDEPVELLVLPRQEFFSMLADSPLTEEAIGKVVQARLAENRAAGRNRIERQK